MAGVLDRVFAELHIDASGRAATRGLSAADEDFLGGAIESESIRREAELAAAIDNGLRLIPRLVRPAVKKVLFG